MDKVKDFLSQKKTYLLLLSFIVGVVVAWSEGQMSTTAAALSIVGALAGGAAKVGANRTENKTDELRARIEELAK